MAIMSPNNINKKADTKETGMAILAPAKKADIPELFFEEQVDTNLEMAVCMPETDNAIHNPKRGKII